MREHGRLGPTQVPAGRVVIGKKNDLFSQFQFDKLSGLEYDRTYHKRSPSGGRGGERSEWVWTVF